VWSKLSNESLEAQSFGREKPGRVPWIQRSEPPPQFRERQAQPDQVFARGNVLWEAPIDSFERCTQGAERELACFAIALLEELARDVECVEYRGGP